MTKHPPPPFLGISREAQGSEEQSLGNRTHIPTLLHSVQRSSADRASRRAKESMVMKTVVNVFLRGWFLLREPTLFLVPGNFKRA